MRGRSPYDDALESTTDGRWRESGVVLRVSALLAYPKIFAHLQQVLRMFRALLISPQKAPALHRNIPLRSRRIRLLSPHTSASSGSVDVGAGRQRAIDGIISRIRPCLPRPHTPSLYFPCAVSITSTADAFLCGVCIGNSETPDLSLRIRRRAVIRLYGRRAAIRSHFANMTVWATGAVR